jgi:hypothetical protein
MPVVEFPGFLRDPCRVWSFDELEDCKARIAAHPENGVAGGRNRRVPLGSLGAVEQG